MCKQGIVQPKMLINHLAGSRSRPADIQTSISRKATISIQADLGSRSARPVPVRSNGAGDSDVARGLFAKAKATGALGGCICNDCRIQSHFDPSHPNYHHFGQPGVDPIRTPICKGESEICNPQAVFRTMLEQARFIAPTLDFTAVTHCSFTVLFGFFPIIPWNVVNCIRTTVDEQNLKIVNYTLPTHIFHPGKITRSIVREGSVVYVYTEGEGTGDRRLLNELTGPLAFKDIDLSLVKRILEKEMEFKITSFFGLR